MTRLTRAELVDLVRRLVESLGDGGLSRTLCIEAERVLKAEEAALKDGTQDAAFRRGAEAMRTALLQRVSWGSDLADRIRAEPVPEDR
jgi:hypothetical protein